MKTRKILSGLILIGLVMAVLLTFGAVVRANEAGTKFNSENKTLMEPGSSPETRSAILKEQDEEESPTPKPVPRPKEEPDKEEPEKDETPAEAPKKVEPKKVEPAKEEPRDEDSDQEKPRIKKVEPKKVEEPVDVDEESAPASPAPIEKKVITPKTVKPVPKPKTEVKPEVKKTSPTPIKPVVKPSPAKPVSKPRPAVKKPYEATTYTWTHWDAFARHVRFTVHQESRLKNLLAKERDRIMQARSEAAEKINRILDEKQRAKWDQMYRQADQKGGMVGDYKKRQLLNPEYLKDSFTLKEDQRRQLYYTAWNMARRIDKIRKQTHHQIKTMMLPKQYDKWESAVKYRIGRHVKF